MSHFFFFAFSTSSQENNGSSIWTYSRKYVNVCGCVVFAFRGTHFCAFSSFDVMKKYGKQSTEKTESPICGLDNVWRRFSCVELTAHPFDCGPGVNGFTRYNLVACESSRDVCKH